MTDAARNKLPKERRSAHRMLYAIFAIALLVFSLVFFASNGFGTRDVTPQNELADYNSAEAWGIINYLKKAETVDESMRIALEYNVIDEEDAIALGDEVDLPELKEQLIEIVRSGASNGTSVIALIEPQQ